MQQQVVLLASSTESIISAWDLHTATQLCSFKNNATPKNCMCRVGSDYIAAAQSNKDALQFWTWHKDQVMQRSFAMERLTAVVAAPGGAMLAAGGVSGAIYIWELASGRLLRNWSAHYKAVTALSFSPCGGVLVSGSEDTLVNAWLMTELLDAGMDPSSPAAQRPQPLHSWSDHSLAVTGLYVSRSGSPAAALVVSSSLDMTVKLRSLGDGALLATSHLPAAATCVVLDAGEHAVYVGAADGGVYEVSLVGEVTEAEEKLLGGAAGKAGGSDGAARREAEALAGFGGQVVLRPHARLAGHAGAVSCLGMSVDGELLVSGSDDGTALVWDVRSRQAVQTLKSPSKLPISCLLVLPRPAHLTAGGSGATSSGGRPGPKRMAPLAPLVKYGGMSGNLKPWESAPVLLTGANSVFAVSGEDPANVLLPPAGTDSWLEAGNSEQGFGGVDEWGLQGAGQQAEAVPVVVSIGATGGGSSGAAGQADEVAKLKAALKAAQEEAASWKSLHAKLHTYCLERVINNPGIG